MSTFREFEREGWEDPGTCAAYHDRLGALVAQATEPLLDAVRVAAADRVLDVGTGAGAVAAAAAHRGAFAVGLDFSAEQLRRARPARPPVAFVRADAEALPMATAGVDVVVSSFGLPHFPDPPAFLRECGRVLRGGGRLGLTTWAAPERSPVFAALLGAVGRHGTADVGLPPGPDYFRYADPAAAARDLTDAGFTAVSTGEVAQVWELATTDDAVDALLEGTIRLSALLRRQAASVLDDIRYAVREQLLTCDDGESVLVPMPAVLIRATRA